MCSTDKRPLSCHVSTLYAWSEEKDDYNVIPYTDIAINVRLFFRFGEDNEFMRGNCSLLS